MPMNPQLPNASEPIAIEETLRVSRAWLRYFADLATTVASLQAQVAALQQAQKG